MTINVYKAGILTEQHSQDAIWELMYFVTRAFPQQAPERPKRTTSAMVPEGRPSSRALSAKVGVMQSAFILVHSPSVGPMTWGPVAEALAVRKHEGVVPSLLGVADAGPPFWPRVVEVVNAAMSRLDRGQRVLLVAHSNAGLFIPLLVAHAARPVWCCLFVDAALPAQARQTPAAPIQLLDFLRGKVSDGRLPPWTEWWDEEDVAPLFPDAVTRAAVTAEQPRLPFAYYEQSVPVPTGWDDDVACGYLLFGPPYDELAADARSRGWLVEELAGRHLHQLVDPNATADRLITMADSLAERG